MKESTKSKEIVTKELDSLRKEIRRLKTLNVSHYRSNAKENACNKLLNSLHRAQMQFIKSVEPSIIFDDLLKELLAMTLSEIGFLAEIVYTNKRNPYLSIRSIRYNDSNPETRALYNEFVYGGMKLYNLNTLYGAIICRGKPVVSNNFMQDSRRRTKLPKAHPAIHRFLGLPFYFEQKLVGVVCIANRPSDYTGKMVQFLQPFLATCGNILQATKNDQRHKLIERALIGSREELKKHKLHFQQLLENRTGKLTKSNQRLKVEILERKQAEDTLRRSQQELREHHNQLQEMVKGQTDKLLLMNKQLKQEILERRKIEEKLKQSLKKQHRTTQEIIKAMSVTVEMKDPYTAGHQRRVTDLVSAIASEMSFTENQINGIKMAAAIHDIGKLNVPIGILNKPCRLSDV